MINKVKRRFKLNELKEFDGKEGRPAYIALKGKVYDVTESSFWKDGRHLKRHSTGDDLTESIINAPHDKEVLIRFPIVGEISEKKFFRQRVLQRIERLHLHSILVHFPIAFTIIGPLFSLLYFFTYKVSFEIASYYMLVLGILISPLAAVSGFFSWKITYERRMTKTFAKKIKFTVLLIVVITACFVWRTLDPNVLTARTILSYIYLILFMSLAPIITILGHYGGKIVYS